MKNHERATQAELYSIFELKHGSPSSTGWYPRYRYKFGHYQADEIYEATVRKQINNDTKWVDVGGGSAIFPHNPALSELLSKQCEKLVAVDPSENVYDNPYAHEKNMCMFEDYESSEKFDLATFRMVAEHIDNPEAVLRKLQHLMKPNGTVIIYTINRYSPIPIITYITPFKLHYKIKKFLWGGEEKDTFPVSYKMNTRKKLKKIFTSHNFIEHDFQHLDDLSAFYNIKGLNILELSAWWLLKCFNIRYPENNLLGIYKYKNN